MASKSAGKFLKLVEKEKIMLIEKAIYKITGLPAQKLGLKNRGLVREGYSADLVLFRDAEIREVLVNGKRTVKTENFKKFWRGNFEILNICANYFQNQNLVIIRIMFLFLLLFY